MWSHDGTTTVLQGTRAGLSPGNALAINNSGESVGSLIGYSSPGTFGQDAVLWSPDGTAFVLPDIGGEERSGAVGINSLGDVVGWAHTGVDYDAVLWSPAAVPEPSTWAMMLLGFMGLGYAGFRRREKRNSPAFAD